MAQKVIWHPNMAPSFLLLHVITNEKSLKFTQIGRLLSASHASPQKHVPTTLVGIPVDIYTLVVLSKGGSICPTNFGSLMLILVYPHMYESSAHSYHCTSGFIQWEQLTLPWTYVWGKHFMVSILPHLYYYFLIVHWFKIIRFYFIGS